MTEATTTLTRAASLSSSMVTGHSNAGLRQSGAGVTLKSIGNNAVSENAVDVAGTVINIPGM